MRLSLGLLAPCLVLACAARRPIAAAVPNPKHAAPLPARSEQPCTIERALENTPLDLRTMRELCPQIELDDDEGSSQAPESAERSAETQDLVRSMLEQACEVSELEGDIECAVARRPELEDFVENHAGALFTGAFTRPGAREALLTLGFGSLLFEQTYKGYVLRGILPELAFDASACSLVSPDGKLAQIACFQTTEPGSLGRTSSVILDVHDLKLKRTTRVFSFRDTLLSSCGDVDANQLVNLVPGPLVGSASATVPRSLALQASYLFAKEPATYDDHCLDLLQRPFEVGPPTGLTAALACAMPDYAATTLEFSFVHGRWAAAPATEDLLDRLAVEPSWFRDIELRALR
jgi:hypothetical protein